MTAGRLGYIVSSVFSPTANTSALSEWARAVVRHRALLVEMISRDLSGQFAGQMIGRLWIIAHPLLLFSVYAMIFSVILKVRVATSLEMPRDYLTYILAGFAPWLMCQLTLAKAPYAFIQHANLVKQVVFPTDVLPLSVVVQACVPLVVGTFVIVTYGVLTGTGPSPSILLLPIALAISLAFLTGIALILAVLTPFFRDLKDLTMIMTVIGVYLVPAFYLPQWVPEALRTVLYLNPFSYIVWMFQDVLYFGEIRHGFAWIVAGLMACLSLALGARVFRRFKMHVADVL